ncbi:hypothetical protein OE88DRAFT_1206296 [Heliocybe sulcata]|uniref:Uncharacterized protein n=1 Tax=Heliocybe sulcata TaxID=5364 RepID=A0A5C3NA24_9AGAM|nr:hypothetical protein OE88DRAFT_1206296 [Heliocybe sulcata]
MRFVSVCWGRTLISYDGVATTFRQMNYQTVYYGVNPRPPEYQLVDVILEKKLDKVKLRGMQERDVVLQISVNGIWDARREPRIWRTFRISAGVKLSIFQDKVICPIMGWLRNYHCYIFTDCRDGVLFGPEVR